MALAMAVAMIFHRRDQTRRCSIVKEVQPNCLKGVDSDAEEQDSIELPKTSSTIAGDHRWHEERIP